MWITVELSEDQAKALLKLPARGASARPGDREGQRTCTGGNWQSGGAAWLEEADSCATTPE